jgi:hypothetical protein
MLHVLAYKSIGEMQINGVLIFLLLYKRYFLYADLIILY